MYPHERSLVKKLADKPFAIIGVNSDSDLDSIREIVKQKNISWRSFWNGPDGTGGAISTKWNVSGWPTVYILDADGRIRFKNPYGDQIDEALLRIACRDRARSRPSRSTTKMRSPRRMTSRKTSARGLNSRRVWLSRRGMGFQPIPNQ